MGYTTEFYGKFTVEPPLNQSEIDYLNKFSHTRRMDRTKGEYYVDNAGFAGQDREDDILDYNRPPSTQPSLWCNWIPTEDGAGIEWNESEKFYRSAEWIEYIIDNFLKPRAKASQSGDPQFDNFTFDHTVSGVIECEGEDRHDVWLLTVDENVVMDNRNTAVYGSHQGG